MIVNTNAPSFGHLLCTPRRVLHTDGERNSCEYSDFLKPMWSGTESCLERENSILQRKTHTANHKFKLKSRSEILYSYKKNTRLIDVMLVE